MKYTHSDLQQIRWRCARRGMKEMDLIFTKFFDENFLILSESEQKIFLELLDESDTTLWDWIFSGVEPDGKYKNLIERIK